MCNYPCSYVGQYDKYECNFDDLRLSLNIGVSLKHFKAEGFLLM